jgi:uncharacterized protein YjbJ (UPF0337 family)
MGDYNKGKDSIGEEASAFGQRAKGDLKEAAGAVTGNRSLESSGTREASMGAARQRSNRMMTGMFRDRDSAEQAYRSLSDRGYGKDDVNLLMSDDTRKKHFSKTDTELGTKAWEDAGKGAAIGGGVGATLAALAAVGTTLALPGLGLLIAGPIAAALAGGGAGALTGGLIGAWWAMAFRRNARRSMTVAFARVASSWASARAVMRTPTTSRMTGAATAVRRSTAKPAAHSSC